MSRLSAYNPKYHDDWAWSLAIKGATNKEIADAFGITERTLIRWYSDNPTLASALQEGKEIADSKVEKALYQRATGMDIEESENIVELDKNGNPKPLKVRTSKKKLAPDTMAIMYWLNNRKRGTWSQRQEVSLGVNEENKEDVIIYLPKIKSEEECEIKEETAAEANNA